MATETPETPETPQATETALTEPAEPAQPTRPAGQEERAELRALLWDSAYWWVASRIGALLTLALFVSLFVGAQLLPGGPFANDPTAVGWMRPFVRWDTGFWLDIAQHGYVLAHPNEAAFYPLYPLLVHLAAPLFGAPTSGHYLSAALAVNTVAALLACVGVALLVRGEAQRAQPFAPLAGRVAARDALWLLLCNPFAFWLVFPYSDALFLGLVSLALYAARVPRPTRFHTTLMILCGLLAGLTRPTALALVPALAWEAWARWRHGQFGEQRHDLRALLPRVAAVIAPLEGLGLYCWYAARVFGSPSAPFVAEARWFGRAGGWNLPGNLWWGLRLMTQDLLHNPLGGLHSTRLLLDALPVVVALVALGLAVWWRRAVAPMLTLFLAASIALSVGAPIVDALFPDAWVGAGRFLLAAAGPLALVALEALRRLRARWPEARVRLFGPALALGVMVQALLMVYVLAGGWLI